MTDMTVLTVELGDARYDITVGRGALARVRELFRLDRRVLIVTDEGVPAAYAEAVASACRSPLILTVKQGEGSKSISTLEHLLTAMLEAGFTRTDAVVAVGGGVVGDLAGFAAASFMRGIDFYNIPTTLLSQVDSSIGGKTAVNLAGVKNCVGAFYQPRAVLIDPDLLSTLPARQLSAGLAEAIKMAATCDAALFRRMEEEDLADILDEIIIGSLRIKRDVVEQDEREGGLRRVLNFGHTLGHGYESAASLSGLLHGECVALGMLPLCSEGVRARLLPVLEKAGLPTKCDLPADEVLAPVFHDKKADGNSIRYIYVDEIGSFRERRMPIPEFCRTVREKLI
jgi:3-dehydroquinate synthase